MSEPLRIAVDCETTGVDHYHGSKPYFVSMFTSDDEQLSWQWEVDPKTRKVSVVQSDVDEIRDWIERADELVFQNAKFDVAALATVGIANFPWHKTQCTLVAGHLLHSSSQHTLDSMVLRYLDEDMTGFEKAVKEATEECRREVNKVSFKEVYGVWKTAKKGQDGMPSAKGEKNWQPDMWLPRAMAMECEYPPDHHYWTVLEEYANADTHYTLGLWVVMEALLRKRGLRKVYEARRKVNPLANGMEKRGITASGPRLRELYTKFESSQHQHIDKCTSIAAKYGYKLDMPKSGNNKSLVDFVYKHLKLPVLKRSDSTGEPSLDKDVIEDLGLTLPPGDGLDFITELKSKRKLDTGLQYMEGYQRFWLPTGKFNKKGEQLWYRLHPSLNPTGTVQLRWSSSNPNSQNISKQEGYNLRYIFGPEDGREWWSLDAQNIELRIPTFESLEPDLMSVFLKPKEPPYYGSYHLVVFDLLHPELFAKHGKDCKDLFESTWYQWVKNGNFAIIYGCQRKRADETYKVKGAYDLVRYRFPKIAQLADRQLALAKKRGYVETIPDKTVDPLRGFPIMASYSDYGQVMPTTPLNYHVSGTAMWWTQQAMGKCEEYLCDLRNRVSVDAWMVMQVHDELVFEFPSSRGDPAEDLAKEKQFAVAHPDYRDKIGVPMPLKNYRSNLGYIRQLQRRMESCGDDINIPTPVGVEWNRDNWAEVTLKC